MYHGMVDLLITDMICLLQSFTAFCGVTSWKRNHNSVLFIAPQARLPFTLLPLPITSYHPPSPLSPLKQVAIEAMDNKTFDLSSTVQMDPPDLKRLQLLLQGSISTQAREPSYTIFVGEYMRWTRLCLSVCCQTPISCLPLAVGKTKGGPGAQSHMSTMIYVNW